MDITLQAQAQISTYLNIASELIILVDEWASVLWVKILGCRPQFVSKKALENKMKEQKQEINLPIKKVYTQKNHEIYNTFEDGTVYLKDAIYRLSQIDTKPSGSNSDYLSLGKLVKKVDEFGYNVLEWHHVGYPNAFKYEEFKCKRDYSGKGAATHIEWTILIPQELIESGYAIARIGTGEGGKGCRSTDIDIILSSRRERIIKV